MERGRPRNFDEEQALEAALRVFWRNGYQGASLDELTCAMGINKPSLYAAFGNKEQLYLRALERYSEQQLLKHADAMSAEPELKKAMRVFLRSIATMLTAPELPGGCMAINSAILSDISTLPKSIGLAIGHIFDQVFFGTLKKRLQEELGQRDLHKGISVEQLADYFFVIMSGMAVVAKVGVTKDRLYKTIEQALCVLPDSK